jgi:hypothetical protein
VLVVLVDLELNYHQHSEIHFLSQIRQLVVDWDIEDLDLHYGLLLVEVVDQLLVLVFLLAVAVELHHSQQEHQFQVRQSNISLRAEDTVEWIVLLMLKMQRKTLDLVVVVLVSKVIVEVPVVPVLFSLHILHKYTQGYIPINNKNIYSL